VLESREPHDRKAGVHPLANLRARQSQVLRSEGDVVFDRCRHDLIVRMLEHDTDQLADVPGAIRDANILTVRHWRMAALAAQRVDSVD